MNEEFEARQGGSKFKSAMKVSQSDLSNYVKGLIY